MSPSVPLLNLPCVPGRYVYLGWGTLFQSARRCYPGDHHYSFAARVSGVKLRLLSSEVIWKCDHTGASKPAHTLYAVRLHLVLQLCITVYSQKELLPKLHIYLILREQSMKVTSVILFNKITE
jgi:hypothetical protein